MEIMEEPNIAELTEKFDECVKVIELYKSLVGDLGEIPEAIQYLEAQEWLTNINDVIAKHIVTYESDQTENIKILENSIISLRKFTDLFKGGMLSEPIFEMTEFHDLLNKSGLDLSTKVAVKKAIGQANYNLVVNKTLIPEEKDEYVEKYRLVYEKKSSVYQAEIQRITEICIADHIELKVDEAISQINDITELYPELSYKGVQNAIVCILLKKELELYEEFIQNDYEEDFKIEFKNQLIEDCEKLLVISRKHSPKENKEESVDNEELTAQEDNLLIEGENIFNQSKEIITAEYELLERVIYQDRENFYRLAYSDNNEDNEITLAIIVDSIKQSLILFEDILKGYREEPELYEQKLKEQISNIKDYLETYQIIKKRLEEAKKNQTSTSKKSEKSSIVYLTNSDNKAFILDYLENENISKTNYRHLKGILNNLENGNRTGSEKEYAINDFTILRITREAITLVYIPLANNTLLVLFADQTSNNIRKTSKDITNNYGYKIKEITSKVSSTEELSLLLAEQAEIRAKIDRYLAENKKSKSK